MTQVFTPYLKADGSAARADTIISKAEGQRIGRGDRWGPFVFTDLRTGTVFKAQGASCGSPRCFCAAEITEIVTPGTAPLGQFD